MVNQNLVLSSSSRVQGDVTLNGPVTFNSSVTFNAGVFGALFPSSATTVSVDVTATNIAWAGCLAKVSSLTFTSNGGNIEVWFNGTINNSGASQHSSLYVLDGQTFVNGQTASRPLEYFLQSNPAGTTVNAGFSYLIQPKPASGAHTLCLGASVDGGTLTINCGSHVCQFGAREVP